MLAGYSIKNIDETKLLDLVDILESQIYQSFRDSFFFLDARGWRFFPVQQTRGFCKYSSKIITIPIWIFSRKDSKEYVIYYLAHEMAHAMLHEKRIRCSHGQAFMEEFKRICPVELQHHELAYKPKNAKAAGISKISNEQKDF